MQFICAIYDNKNAEYVIKKCGYKRFILLVNGTVTKLIEIFWVGIEFLYY